MKILLFSLTFGLFLALGLLPSSSYAQQQTLSVGDEDIVIEIEPETNNLFIVYDEEISDDGYAYILKIRLTKNSVENLSDIQLSTGNLNALTEEQLEKVLGPLLGKMEEAVFAAEKKCKSYKCKQIILEPRFEAIYDSKLTITNSVKAGKPTTRITTVILHLPKVDVKTPRNISRAFFYFTTFK